MVESLEDPVQFFTNKQTCLHSTSWQQMIRLKQETVILNKIALKKYKNL